MQPVRISECGAGGSTSGRCPNISISLFVRMASKSAKKLQQSHWCRATNCPWTLAKAKYVQVHEHMSLSCRRAFSTPAADSDNLTTMTVVLELDTVSVSAHLGAQPHQSPVMCIGTDTSCTTTTTCSASTVSV
eukprot:scpid106372/ scgid17196/ 